jgi:hypothetical protein
VRRLERDGALVLALSQRLLVLVLASHGDGLLAEENVQLGCRGFDLWTRGDLEGFLETIDPAIG